MHTGDPIFPTITNLMQFPDTQFWTRDFGLYFTETIAKGELVLDRSLLNWAIYPVLSIFNIAERLEGGRTGLGIFSLLILPLAVAGLCRADLRRREYIIPLAIAFIFFIRLVLQRHDTADAAPVADLSAGPHRVVSGRGLHCRPGIACQSAGCRDCANPGGSARGSGDLQR